MSRFVSFVLEGYLSTGRLGGGVHESVGSGDDSKNTIPLWLLAIRTRVGLRQRGQDLMRRDWRLVDLDPARAQRIVDRVEDGGRRRDGAAFADALDPVFGVG